MRRGFDHKLLPPYRITKIKDDETAALDIESSRARPNGTCPDDNPEGGDYGQLLPLQQITSAKDCKDAAAEPKSENSAPNESYLDNTQSAEYGRLNSIDLNDSARNSEEDVTWPIPPTALPEGGLSPF